MHEKHMRLESRLFEQPIPNTTPTEDGHDLLASASFIAPPIPITTPWTPSRRVS